MVIAGAGSGKTRVLTYRLAYLIGEVNVDPFRILALTFTNKAAKEMRERIQKLVGPEARNIWMGTFHSIFSKLLRREAEKLGYTSNFTIYDDDDSTNLIKRIVKELNLDDKKFKPRVVANHISSAKNSLVNPDDYAIQYVTDSFTNIISRIYKIYCTRCFESNAMDFDDLLVKPVELFEKDPDTLQKYQERFQYIMVDEYQDTNHAQYVITKMLAGVHHNICVVGDDAQSIYSFRGANIENILNFRKDYPNTRIYKLEENYRSTQTIVNAANDVIAKNKNQIKKNVFTNNDLGDSIRVIESGSDQEEGRLVSDSIREQMMRYGYKAQDFAILYRTNSQSRAIETELRKANLRYRIFGGLSFYKRKEIKDVLAYMRLAINTYDEEALLRVINYPTRGIGKTTMDKLVLSADEQKMKLWDVVEKSQLYAGLPSRIASLLDDFCLKIRRYGVEAKKNAYEAAKYIANDSGILKDLHADKDNFESLSRWENVQELLNAAQEFTEDTTREDHSLVAFLQEVSLFSDQDKEEDDHDYVTLMTIHMAKGLEFPSVFIVGLEEELFPNAMSMTSRADLEEERRLFYVAVTRARERLALTHARSRYRFGSLQFNEPSRFLSEIDDQYLSLPGSIKRRVGTSGGGLVDRSASVVQRERPSTPTPPNNFTSVNTVRARPGLTKSNSPGDDLSGLTPGMTVEHEKFGRGKVVSVDGKDNERKATIVFETSGSKVLLLKYARLTISG